MREVHVLRSGDLKIVLLLVGNVYYRETVLDEDDHETCEYVNRI